MNNMPKPGQEAKEKRGEASPSPEPQQDATRLGDHGVERRRSTREPVITVGMIRPLTHDDAPPEQVLVTNVSLHGVGVRATRALPVGARYHIEIGVGPLHLTSRLRVVRCRLRHDGTYDVGGEFC
jgi:hypothetical protein